MVLGLFVEGLTILAARPKIGKSWLMLAVAAAVASGGKVLGSVPVVAGDVLYLALEDTPRRMKSRLRKLLGDGALPSQLHIAFAKDWPRADRDGLTHLELFLNANPQCRMVVIDTWARFRPNHSANESGYASDYADIEPLQEMAGRRHVAIVLVHHLRKATAEDWIDTLSGTLGLAGAADGLLGIFRARGEATAVLKVTGRDLEEQEFGLRFDAERGAWTLLGSAADVALSTERLSILDVLRAANRPMAARELALATDRTLTATQKMVYRMVSEGQVVTPRTGWYSINTSSLSYLSYGSEQSDLSDLSDPPRTPRTPALQIVEVDPLDEDGCMDSLEESISTDTEEDEE